MPTTTEKTVQIKIQHMEDQAPREVDLVITEEDRTPREVYIKTTSRSPAPIADTLWTVAARERVEAALQRVIDAEGAVRHLHDDDLANFRERLWLLLGRMDDEWDRSSILRFDPVLILNFCRDSDFRSGLGSSQQYGHLFKPRYRKAGH